MTTALYRRYRPETFDEVIGQDHVTEPLKAALRSNRVTHAYLFSGPRGCGKTTSARILARCLNCVEGPTDTPCGVCESCRELATGGPGSLDVVEIDAASHNGVDDARELRERATFAPVRDRYKVFILDEAHMVTPQGFNALLKLVEEPPEHVKFVFATTEPERVIGTIRSRTHHYPFRLVPADAMTPFLAQLSEQESVKVGEGVLPLVVRAGGGSVRDSLSVLDQLMAGSIDSEITYDRAVALLGYTDTNLLDSAVEALGNRDGAAIFATIESMVESGHDPRRFVEDFLQRLRDLLIIAVAGEDARDILSELPSDQRERMFEQAKQWGAPALSTAADLTDEALRTMVGATSPRLQLELLVGRILVALASPAPVQQPTQGVATGGVAGGMGGATGAGGAAGGYAGGGAPAAPGIPETGGPQIMGPDGKPLTGAALAREQLRRSRSKQEVETEAKEALSDAASAPGAQALQSSTAEKLERESKSEPAREPARDAVREDRREQKRDAQESAQFSQDAPQDQHRASEQQQAPKESQMSSSQTQESAPREQAPEVEQPKSEADTQQASSETQAPEPQSHGDVTSNLHGKWDEFVEAVRAIMPSSAYLIGEHATLVSEDASTVTLGFTNQNFVNVFMGRHVGPATQAIQAVTGVHKTPVAVVGRGDQGNQGGQQQAPSYGQPQNRSGQQQAHAQQQAQDRGSQQQAQQQQQSSTAWPTVREVPSSGDSSDEEDQEPREQPQGNEPEGAKFQTFEGGAKPQDESGMSGTEHGNPAGAGRDNSSDAGAGSADVSGAPASTEGFSGDSDEEPNSYQRIPHPSGQSQGRGPRLRTYDGGQKANQDNDQPSEQVSGDHDQQAGQTPGQPDQQQSQRDQSDQQQSPHGGQSGAGSQNGTSQSASSRPGQQQGGQQHPGQNQACADEPSQPSQPNPDYNDPTGGARIDDVGAENMNLVGLPLVEKMFGAKVIEDNEGNN